MDESEVIKITVSTRSEMESKLEMAVQRLIQRAQGYRDRGILITRNSAQDFTIQLDMCVPFGLTRELENW